MGGGMQPGEETEMGHGEIREASPGVWEAFLPPCDCHVLPHVLVPDPASHVWLVEYRPHAPLAWADLPLPLDVGRPARILRARLPSFDLQMPLPQLLALLPEMHAWAGMLALQMSRPVPDTLHYQTLAASPSRDAILRRNGWLLTFSLPHDGETARVTTPDRAHLQRILADPAVVPRPAD